MLPEWSEPRRRSRRRPIAPVMGGRYSNWVTSIAETYRTNRGRLWRLVRRILLLLVLIPGILVPVYRFVPPVSTLMVFDWVTSAGNIERTGVPFADIAPGLGASVPLSE